MHEVCSSTLYAAILRVRIRAGGARSTGVPTATPEAIGHMRPLRIRSTSRRP
jgi:hypothetical protein